MERRPASDRAIGDERHRGGWVVAAAGRDTRRRFRNAWHALPPAARRRFGGWILYGWLAGALLATVMGVAGRTLAEAGMADCDLQQLRELLDDSPMSFQAAIWFEGLGSSAMLIPVCAAAIVIAARCARPLYALAIAAAYVLHDPLIFLIHWIWPRTRPDLVAGGIAAPPMDAFPSGHTVQVIAVYGLFAWFWVRRATRLSERLVAALLVALLAAVVGYARMRLGTHWPSDVIGAVPLGLAWLLVCIGAVRAAERVAGAAGAADRAPLRR